jgi:hypothetical protein
MIDNDRQTETPPDDDQLATLSPPAASATLPAWRVYPRAVSGISAAYRDAIQVTGTLHIHAYYTLYYSTYSIHYSPVYTTLYHLSPAPSAQNNAPSPPYAPIVASATTAVRLPSSPAQSPSQLPCRCSLASHGRSPGRTAVLCGTTGAERTRQLRLRGPPARGWPTWHILISVSIRPSLSLSLSLSLQTHCSSSTRAPLQRTTPAARAMCTGAPGRSTAPC